MILDETRVLDLANRIAACVAAHYRSGPVGDQAVYEALNGLSLAAGIVLAGTGKAPTAMQFFYTSLECAIREVQAEIPIHPGSPAKN